MQRRRGVLTFSAVATEKDRSEPTLLFTAKNAREWAENLMAKCKKKLKCKILQQLACPKRIFKLLCDLGFTLKTIPAPILKSSTYSDAEDSPVWYCRIATNVLDVVRNFKEPFIALNALREKQTEISKMLITSS